MSDTWDPQRYERFAAERRQPFDDLVAMLDPCPGGQAVDLGCGTGALTVELHRALGAGSTVGIDSSAAMLAEATPRAGGGVRFELGDLDSYDGGPVDVIAANASLQWVGDHRSLLARLVAQLTPGGQLAFQVPANGDHPSHVVAHALAESEAWAPRFDGGPPPRRAAEVLAPETYAEVLDAMGLVNLQVRLQVYGHHLESSESVVEWVRATLLTPFEARLDHDTYAAFLEQYRRELLGRLGDARPYFYAFKRILVKGRRPA